MFEAGYFQEQAAVKAFKIVKTKNFFLVSVKSKLNFMISLK